MSRHTNDQRAELGEMADNASVSHLLEAAVLSLWEIEDLLAARLPRPERRPHRSNAEIAARSNPNVGRPPGMPA